MSPFDVRCHATNVHTTVRVRPLKLDFSGTCTFRVGGGAGAHQEIELLGLELSARLPDAGGAEDGGTITIRVSDSRTGEPTTNTGTLAVGVTADLTATVDQPGGAIEVVSRKPVELAGELTELPPRDGRMRLGGPVEFVVPDGPDTTVVQLRDLLLRLEGSLSAQ